ncbi:hypothetical protein ACFU99_14135 [Streptomyces sp. NPDC057654]|uniref:hypothetical protein n=1 Tax=Streptomyces sp. NPDC057654 TaxID=3346196 RepID=UPI0036930CA0
MLEALAAGVKCALECTVCEPAAVEVPSHAYEADTTHVFSIEPEPTVPRPPGAGRHRKPSAPSCLSGWEAP